MFEEAVKFTAVKRTPGTVQVVSSLRLLPRVIVIQKLQGDERQKQLLAKQQHFLH